MPVGRWLDATRQSPADHALGRAGSEESAHRERSLDALAPEMSGGTGGFVVRDPSNLPGVLQGQRGDPLAQAEFSPPRPGAAQPPRVRPLVLVLSPGEN